MYELAILTLFPAAVIFAGCMDLVSYRIPNKVSLLLIAGFLALAPFVGMSLMDFGGHLAAGALVLAVTFALFAFRVLGGGDAKLAAAVSLWMGLPMVGEYVLVAALFGGLLGTVLITFRALPVPVGLASQSWVARLHAPKGDIPYGIALAAAAMVMYPHTVWVKSLAG